MIKNYLKIFLKTAGQNRLFTSLSLFGISLTIMFIMIFSMALEKILGGSEPVEDLKDIMFTGYVMTVETSPSGNRTSTGNCGRVLGEQYLKKIVSSEVTSMYSRLSSWEFIMNGRVQVKDYSRTDAEFWDIYKYNYLQGRPYTREEVMKEARQKYPDLNFR